MTGSVAIKVSRLRWIHVVTGLAAMVLAAAIGVAVGPASISPMQVVIEAMNGLGLVETDSGLTDQQVAILWQIRVPRVVLGLIVGSLLAVAGASYQGIFRNPLADPYLLGVAAGAGLGATVAFGLRGDLPSWAIGAAAFSGGIVAVAATYVLGRSAGRLRATTTLILAGVAVAAFLTAIQTFVLQRNSDVLREVYSWVLGRLSTVGWTEVLVLLPYAAVSWIGLLAGRRLLDVLAVDDEEASGLGIQPARVRAVLISVATLATAAAVAVSGLIGFVGIIVPHAVRLVAGTSYRLLVPLSIMFGAAFLVLADVAARTIMSPAELPIGVVTAFVGAPFFLLVLSRAKSS